MDKTQIKEMRDFSSQKITYEEITTILKEIYPSVRGYSVKSTNQICKKQGISPRIFQDYVRTMISEAVAEVRKNFYKNFFFFLSHIVCNFCESFQTLLDFA